MGWGEKAERSSGRALWTAEPARVEETVWLGQVNRSGEEKTTSEMMGPEHTGLCGQTSMVECYGHAMVKPQGLTLNRMRNSCVSNAAVTNCCKQTNFVALNNNNFLSCGSGRQKPGMVLSGQTSRCQRGWDPFWRLRGESLSLLTSSGVQRLTSSSDSMSPFSIFRVRNRGQILLT